MGRDVKSKRTYRSPHRRAQADATKRDILAAAEVLFERQGYPATTMAQVAQGAGVALKTVYLAFETKSGLLRALWNLRLRGDDDSRPVLQQEWYRRVLEEPNPERRLRLNARNSTEGKQRISGILEVIRSAAPTDTEIAALWERIQSEYHENQRAVVERLHRHGHLRPELDVDRAADILWTINHPNTWQLLVVDRGWRPADYERWTGDVACAQLLPPRRRRTKATAQAAPETVDGSNRSGG
jgi:AcrR family transcriptional regulator